MGFSQFTQYISYIDANILSLYYKNHVFNPSIFFSPQGHSFGIPEGPPNSTWASQVGDVYQKSFVLRIRLQVKHFYIATQMLGYTVCYFYLTHITCLTHITYMNHK